MKQLPILGLAMCLAGCSTTNSTDPLARYPANYPPVGPEGLLDGTEAEKTTIIENGVKKDVFWSTLSESQRRALYSSQSVVIAVSRIESNGSLVPLPGAVSVGKGNYDLLYRYQLYRQTPCRTDNSAAGSVRVGVGLTIRARFQSKSGSLNLSTLVPLAASASAKKANGRIQIDAIGIGGGSPTLASYLGGGTEINIDSVTKALESLAVVKAVIENPSNITTPSYLQLLETTPGSCSGGDNIPNNAILNPLKGKS
jgi:hypothetical protein